MADLPESLFLNPIWHSLRGPHRPLALARGAACRYPADVAPFAAVEFPSRDAFEDLLSLLGPNESVWMADSPESVAALEVIDCLECVQMALRDDAALRSANGEIIELTADDAPDMLALTDLAFPGFFRAGTHRLGFYCGVRVEGQLVAMGGERLQLPGFPELSGICSHPAYRGLGLAARVIRTLVARHRSQGLTSWLHVGAANSGAIELYRLFGFRPVRSIVLNRVARAP